MIPGTFYFSVSLALGVAGGSAVQVDSVVPLPGTQPLHEEADLTELVIEGANAFLDAEIRRVAEARDSLWERDYSSRAAYESSVTPNRDRLRRYIGLADQRVPASDLELVAGLSQPALAAETADFRALAVRWPVLPGVDAEGLLLEPKGPVRAQVIVLPDADWSPESVAGLDPSIPARQQVARRLVESGCRVLVPTLIDRSGRWSGNPDVRMKPDISHREFVYLLGYTLGRHIIGYEVQRTLAAVDYFETRDSSLPVGVLGYGEGGLIAFYSAAADTRIDAVFVSGYFQEREEMWKEPVYRSVWGMLHEFGDAGLASLIAPRPLVIEASRGPEGPARPASSVPARAIDGSLRSPALPSVRAEFARASRYYERLASPRAISLAISSDGQGQPFSDGALKAFVEALRLPGLAPAPARTLIDLRRTFDPSERLRRQYDQLVAHTQDVMRHSPLRRSEFWAEMDPASPLARNTFQRARAWKRDEPYPVDRWERLTRSYREYFWEDVLGRSPAPSVPPNTRTRMIFDEPGFRGYEVVMDVWPGAINYGMLLVPKNIPATERRPVVVAVHGHAGSPKIVVDPEFEGSYHKAGVDLANRGFVVYAPQNLFTLDDRYPLLHRRGHPIKQSAWSVLVGQHQQLLGWLKGLPFVDGSRIGFYGKSYGGKAALFLPAILEDYALSISSGDWSERVWKNSSLYSDYSFPFTGNFAQIEYNFGEKFNYAEIAGLIAPRPFMVERGHYDNVSPPEWVDYEFSRARWLYTHLGIGDRIEIEHFMGGHEMNKKGTFEFLHRHLDWPEPN